MTRPSMTKRRVRREVDGGRQFGPLVVEFTDSALLLRQKRARKQYTVAYALIMWAAAKAEVEARRPRR